ncbi:uncharacterized protein Z518_10666 [Rhinocladiella mackenziei CBS 650.93]|uniref:DNA-directed RNA polymerase RBP11-like dimerisation domain-containing protein n=1 Tax=Rhinocladiella mackenziei CBS 650.93 TaxID=1442369 RepID=A0A0D2IB74_9EURO|nr:uncharacterized protein Z518_10666 [Rhinocladiella mackenziei CBS 650.93]KIX00526.1 hypothetical protein Z518_10666 [Rhinocladiella mackenziei CBS 650.93]
MSDPPGIAPIPRDENPPTNLPIIRPRRSSDGTLLLVEHQKWPDHPQNKKYIGSEDSAVNNANANNPAENNNSETTPQSAAKLMTDLVIDVTRLAEGSNSGSKSRQPGSIYPGSGPHGLPLDGTAWRYHPSNRRFHTYLIDHPSINKIEWTEAFLLDDDEKKIEEKIDTRTPNTVIFTFNKEDHTLANLLRDKLLKNSHVTFAAYRVPHPLFAKFELRVQTDGGITPKEAVLASSRDLVHEFNVLKTNFTREYELRKMVGGTQNLQ